MRRLWVAIAGLFAAGAVATPLALTQGGGSIDVIVGGTPTAAAGCAGTSVNTSTFATAFSNATGGDTLCLATGSYGTFSGGDKSSPGVTIKPADGATVTFTDLNFNTGDDWIIVEGVTTSGCDFGGTANNITLRTTTVRHICEFDTASMDSSSAILLDQTDHPFNLTPSGPGPTEPEGRITFTGGHATNNAAVTIRNATFHGNCADGIQYTAGPNAGRGVTVEDSEFYDLEQDTCNAIEPWRSNPDCFPTDNASCPAPHVDAVQWVEGRGSTYRRNWFHDVSNSLVDFDGDANSTTVTNNVFGPNGGAISYCLGGSSNAVFEHNTVISGPLYLCVNHAGTPSTNVTWRNNIQWENPSLQGSSSYASGSPHHDICLSAAAGGAGDTCAGTGSSSNVTPAYVGGSDPATFDEWSDFQLASGTGKNAASDGQDIGIDGDL